MMTATLLEATSAELSTSGEIQSSPSDMAADIIQPSTGKLLSKKNKPDYCVYSLSKTGGGLVKIVAVIDAKLNLGLHAI